MRAYKWSYNVHDDAKTGRRKPFHPECEHMVNVPELIARRPGQFEIFIDRHSIFYGSQRSYAVLHAVKRPNLEERAGP